MSHYLAAPEVVVLIDKKAYKVSTPSSFNTTTKPGDEIVGYSYTGGQKVVITSREVETAGDGLSFTVALGDEILGSPAVFSYSCNSKNDKSDSEGTVVPHIPS